VYPNPTFGPLTIELPDDIKEYILEVYDFEGRMLQRKEVWKHEDIDLDLHDLPAGQYTIEVYPVRNTERIFYSQKVIKVE